jgi:hypothetical protein
MPKLRASLGRSGLNPALLLSVPVNSLKNSLQRFYKLQLPMFRLTRLQKNR